MRTISWNKFDGGMTADPRDPSVDVARSIKHFDDYTRSYKLTPYRDMVKDAVTESGLNNYGIQKFVVTNTGIFGVGYVSTDGHTQVYSKTSLNDPTAVWTAAPGTSTSASSVESFIQPIIYHNYIYGVNVGGVWKYGDITSGGSETFTYNEYTSNIPTAQGLVHSKDDILYWPSNNKILANNNGSWSNPISMPTNSTINSICEYGNYLAIAADQADGTCSVYLWDRNASLSTLPEIVHWGAGSIKLIETVAGVLCAVSTTANTGQSLTPRVMIKYYSGSQVITLKEFVCTIVNITPVKQIWNNIFYFLAELTIDGTAYKGLWKIFKNPSGSLAFGFDRLPRNDTALNGGSLHGFIRWGDYVFISYNNPADSDKYTIWRTNDEASYTATSIYESVINPIQPERYRAGAGTRSDLKSLVAVAVGTEVMTTGQQVVLKYRVDGGSWITIATITYQASPTPLNSNVVHEYNVDASGNPFQNGREFEFRVESTGGAEITELKYKTEVLETKL